MPGLRGSQLKAHILSSWELVLSGVLQVCAVTCPVWHHYPGGSDKKPFTVTRLPVSPRWNDGTIHRLDAAIQRDLDRLRGRRAEPCAVQQGQLNSCSSPEVLRERPNNSYFRDKNPLKHWRQVCYFLRGDQHHKEKASNRVTLLAHA